ncbi:Shikimate kinase [Mycobacterium talmoniae]|uniref:Shikimate kinase n=1 Tax=Mycobacterium talmoniae TaxID=1858794 RepID=A0A2S8BDA5_9MYCO|nr:Shikimate kinase [Mycobacterium talmoniae]
MAPKAVLVGLPGSGKSTIGRRLAKTLGVDLLDTDAAIEQQTGRSIADIFATDGEAEFRRIEEQVIRQALDEHDGVLSLGGGAVTTDGVRDALAGHTVVFLEISAAEGVRRTGGNTVGPLLAGGDRAEKFRALMAHRVPLYRRVATFRVNTNRRNPGAVVRYIVARLENPTAPVRRAAQLGAVAPDPRPARPRRCNWRPRPSRRRRPPRPRPPRWPPGGPGSANDPRHRAGHRAGGRRPALPGADRHRVAR